MNRELPKKILVIRDCTFILPEDFSGTLEDAFTEFLKYRINLQNKPKIVDEHGLFSAFNVLLHYGTNECVCGEYALYELIDDKYKLIDGTGYNKEITP